MPRRLSLEWPDPGPFRGRGGAIRILAISDQLDPALAEKRNRDELGAVDLVVGCGDLAASDLAFVADGLNAPLVYVLGNHDGDERWQDEAGAIPYPLTRHCELGIDIAGLSWPGQKGRVAERSDLAAWRQGISVALHRLGRTGPLLIVSHVPPEDAGDIASDAYHRGFAAYRWVLRRLRPPLWLHGHTPLAAVSEWCVTEDATTIVNATGGVLVELCPSGATAPR